MPGNPTNLPNVMEIKERPELSSFSGFSSLVSASTSPNCWSGFFPSAQLIFFIVRPATQTSLTLPSILLGLDPHYFLLSSLSFSRSSLTPTAVCCDVCRAVPLIRWADINTAYFWLLNHLPYLDHGIYDILLFSLRAVARLHVPETKIISNPQFQA